MERSSTERSLDYAWGQVCYQVVTPRTNPSSMAAAQNIKLCLYAICRFKIILVVGNDLAPVIADTVVSVGIQPFGREHTIDTCLPLYPRHSVPPVRPKVFFSAAK
jgi:hypothetical protein